MKIKVLSWDAENGHEIISAHATQKGLEVAIELLMRRNLDYFKSLARRKDYSEFNVLLESGHIMEAMEIWNTAQHDWLGEPDDSIFIRVDELEVGE